MSKEFRAWKIDEAQLLPASVQDYVPPEHLSRLIVALVREELDLSAIAGSYRSVLGQPPFDPRMMTALLLHGYASGVYSSRRIAKAAVERADFMMIVAGDPPDFRTIAEFRKRHLKGLAALFVQVLRLAEKAGLVKLGHVALDGSKIKANASKHKAMSYERMKRREIELASEVARWLKAGGASHAGGGQALRRQARRGDAHLGGRQRTAAGEYPRGKDGAGSRNQGRRRSGKAASGRGAEDTHCRGAQKERPNSGAAQPGTRRQDAAQLHRSRQPHSADQGWVHPRLQRTSRCRFRSADHRRTRPDTQHERPRSTRAADRCHQKQSRPPAQRSLRRRRLLQ